MFMSPLANRNTGKTALKTALTCSAKEKEKKKVQERKGHFYNGVMGCMCVCMCVKCKDLLWLA